MELHANVDEMSIYLEISAKDVHDFSAKIPSVTKLDKCGGWRVQYWVNICRHIRNSHCLPFLPAFGAQQRAFTSEGWLNI